MGRGYTIEVGDVPDAIEEATVSSFPDLLQSAAGGSKRDEIGRAESLYD